MKKKEKLYLILFISFLCSFYVAGINNYELIKFTSFVAASGFGFLFVVND